MSKERGIIFNAEMVRAILAGNKTQTRRVANVGRERGFTDPVVFGKKGNVSSVYFTPGVASCCPFGDVGDRIWVRETWAQLGNEDGCAIDWNDNLVKGGGPDAALIYRASCEQRTGNYGLWSIPDDADWKPHTDDMQYEGAWVPSIHMPRWASRVLLEITNVRVERLNDISEADSRAEGITLSDDSLENGQEYRVNFRNLWWEIYGVENWHSNPWVWVIEFKRVEVSNEQ